MDQPTNPDCSFLHAKSVYLNRGGSLLAAGTTPGFSQSSDAAWTCLAGHVRHRMEDGTIFVPDTLGRFHRLTPCHRHFPNTALMARAFLDEEGCAIVSPALTLMLMSASFGIWCHPAFEPWTGNPARIELPPITSGIPLGFEAILLTQSKDPVERAMLEARRDWLAHASTVICPIRREMAVATARNAAHWIWAHETGHLLGGHHLLDIGGRADISALVADHDAQEQLQTKPELALEMLADRWATRRVAAGAIGATGQRLRSLAIGGLLAMSLFEASYVISGRPWKTVSHPGNWFRAQSFLDELEAAAGRELGLLPTISRLAKCLGHCGLWLTPALEGGYQNLAGQFVEEALDSLIPYHETLRAQGASLVKDLEGLSTDCFPLRAG